VSGDLWYNFNWDVIWRHFDKLYLGLALGLGIAVLSLLIGSLIGLAAAVARTSAPRPIRLAVTAYVEFLRNIPILLLAYFSFYGLPLLGVSFLNNVASFVFALSLYAGAYLAEVFRAGIASVPAAYLEAAKAIGLTRFQRFRLVTLPVTLRITLPALSNNFISLFKDTSLASAIAVPELTWGAMWINVNTFRVLEAWITAGLLYLGACYVIALALRALERRYAVIR
jgi:His/Glu/Gln/Arg/opine family amino acid ABC transporter permease subunit